ncbi:MAG: thermonuclease family protein [Dehalococcoidia bacterium]
MRASRTAVIGPLVLVVIAVIAIAVARTANVGSGGGTNLPAASVAARPIALDERFRSDLPTSAFEQGRVTRIIDGDTLDAKIGGRTLRVRIFGINAPEAGDRCGPAATEGLKQLLGPGTQALFHPGPRNDDGRRLLRYVFTVDDRMSVDAFLIDAGLAEAWRRDGQLRDQLVEVETHARAAGRGCLWAP